MVDVGGEKFHIAIDDFENECDVIDLSQDNGQAATKVFIGSYLAGAIDVQQTHNLV